MITLTESPPEAYIISLLLSAALSSLHGGGRGSTLPVMFAELGHRPEHSPAFLALGGVTDAVVGVHVRLEVDGHGESLVADGAAVVVDAPVTALVDAQVVTSGERLRAELTLQPPGLKIRRGKFSECGYVY